MDSKVGLKTQDRLKESRRKSGGKKASQRENYVLQRYSGKFSLFGKPNAEAMVRARLKQKKFGSFTVMSSLPIAFL